jgi:hypothetical protein
MFSALPLTTDIAQRRRHVGKVPVSDIADLASMRSSGSWGKLVAVVSKAESRIDGSLTIQNNSASIVDCELYSANDEI